jgi:hypothetical protein
MKSFGITFHVEDEDVDQIHVELTPPQYATLPPISIMFGPRYCPNVSLRLTPAALDQLILELLVAQRENDEARQLTLNTDTEGSTR